MREEQLFEETVKYSGVFDFNELYKFIVKFWDKKNYLKLEEKNYRDTGGKKLDIIEMKCLKKISDYFRFYFKIKIKSPNLDKIIAKKGKKKIKTNKGEISISLGPKLLYDYNNEWEKTIVHRFFREIYDKWIIKNRVDKYKEDLTKEVREFTKQLRNFLGTERM